MAGLGVAKALGFGSRDKEREKKNCIKVFCSLRVAEPPPRAKEGKICIKFWPLPPLKGQRVKKI
jgi:hypothetical protein